MVDDDLDDQYLVQEAWLELNLESELRFVSDGEELLEYLQKGLSSTGNPSQLPNLILLDLNMPRKNGKRALEEIKSIPEISHIPIVILTTSKDPVDIHHCYSHGAAGFVTKPATFNDLLNTIQTIEQYWFKTVSLPGRNTNE
jgi:CheY-like chemotaxis protein